MIIQDETNSSEVSKACLLAKRLIDEFQKKHPEIASSSQMAKRIGIKQASMNRIENLNTNPSLELIIDIIVGTDNQGRMFELLGELNIKLKDSFLKSLSNIKVAAIEDNLAEYFSREDFCFILLLALPKLGTTREQVFRELGAVGLKNLEKLLKQSILKEDNSGIISLQTAEVFLPPAVLKRVLSFVLTRFNEGSAVSGTICKEIMYKVKVVNKENALKVISKRLTEAFLLIEEDLKKDESKGNDLVFVGAFSDVITKQKDSYLSTYYANYAKEIKEKKQ